MKRCSNCERTRPLYEFPLRTRNGARVTESYCKVCKPLMTAKWGKMRRDRERKAREEGGVIVSTSTGSYRQGNGSFSDLKGHTA